MSKPVISSDKIQGTAIYNPAGDKLGSIEKLLIDKASGQVHYAIMEFGGFLGMGTDHYPIPWSMLIYDAKRDAYVVPLDKSRLEDAPRHPPQDMPDYSDPNYARHVRDYYGVAWE